MMKKYEILFLPSSRRGHVAGGETVYAVARRLGEQIESVCGGAASCGKCRVKVLQGSQYGIDSSPDHLGPPGDVERRLRDEGLLGPDERLACQATVEGDIVVFVPEGSRVLRQAVLKDAGDRRIDIVPAVRNYYLDLAADEISNGPALGSRLVAELETRFGIRSVRIDPYALEALTRAAALDVHGVSVTVWEGEEVIRVRRGLHDRSYGVALDIGTTTVGCYLCDLQSGEAVATESMVNPQIAFGEDVMTRIAYAKQQPGGRDEMRRGLIGGLNQLIRTAVSRAGLETDDVVELAVVGNTVMHHVFLGLDIVPLGMWPFAPALERSTNVKARELGIEVLPSANVHVLPIEAAFVGADNVGVLIAEEPYNQDEVVLIVDIGTNGELVLGNRNRLLSASCATGPAFEGANITFGVRAVPGAIDTVRVDPETMEVQFTLISAAPQSGEERARGICGSGIIDSIAEMLAAGVIKPNGSIDRTSGSPRLRIGPDGKPEYVIAWAAETAIGRDIVVTQRDVRAVQLAKAAIRAGAELMLARLGVARPDKVILAGAFGTVIDRQRAAAIGMLPHCELEKIVAVGNAAGDGARIALLNREKRTEADWIARKVEYIELTAEPGFEEAFIGATVFPGQTGPVP